MKFRVDREVLGEAVSWVARALATRPVVPVLSGLLLQADDDLLTLSCFDYEVSARVQVPAEVGEPGTALVPGRLLAEIVKSLPPAEVEVASAAEMVMLTCGSAEFALVSLPLEDYPKLPELPAAVGAVDGGVLATAAAQVVPSASRDDTLPMLTGVCLDFAGAELTLAATDRYRLAVRTVSWEPGDPSMHGSALIPARTLAEAARTMSTSGLVTISCGASDPSAARPADGLISFEGGGRRLTARLIGAEFIRYASRFPKSFEASAELPAVSFTEAVRRVALVADRTTPVQLAFRRDLVVIEARSDGRARAVESVAVDFTGREQVISFNPHYLLDGLAAAMLTGQTHSGQTHSGQGVDEPSDAPGRIRLQFTSPAKPALITWVTGDEVADTGNGGDGSVGPVVESTQAEGNADADDEATFRYLVVPLRTQGSVS